MKGNMSNGVTRVASGEGPALGEGPRGVALHRVFPQFHWAMFAALTLACGSKAVNLDEPGALIRSMDPNVLGIAHEQVTQIAVDDERLYWAGTREHTDGYFSSAVRSCEKENCAATVVTYDASHANYRASFGVHEGEVYWFHEDFQDTEVQALVACPVSGCVNAPRTIVAAAPPGWSSVQATFDDDGIYFSEEYVGVYRVGYAENAGEPRLVASFSGSPFALAAQGDYLYWLERGESVAIRRTRKDGSQSPELLARNLPIVVEYGSSDGAAPQGGFALDLEHFYWSQNGLAGSIQRCPLSGCVGAPEVVVPEAHAPAGLLLADAQLYWAYRADEGSYSLAKCELAACKPSDPLASGLATRNALASDDRYLYASTSETITDSPTSNWRGSSAAIRRFPK